MKFYVYISDTKIEMLFPQLKLDYKEKQRKAKFGFDLKLLKGEIEEVRNLASHTHEKIEAIVDALRRVDQVGSIHSNKPFIYGEMELEWVDFGRIDKENSSPLSYWVGCFDNTLVALAGSQSHIIGKSRADGVAGYSSLLPDVEYWLRKALNEISSQKHSEIIVDENYNHHRVSVDSATISEVVLRSKYERNRRIGVSKRYEFVAKVLHQELDTELCFGDGCVRNLVLATPLYVALC